MIEFFEPMVPPSATHNGLEPCIRRGRPSIRKSDALREAEAAWRAHLARHAPEKPLAGPISVEMRICWPTGGRHPQGSPHAVRPDADNVEKTVFDVMAELGFFENDSRIAVHTTAKLWSDPAGIYVRMEELPRNGRAPASRG